VLKVDLKVEDVMISSVITIDAGYTVRQAAKIMVYKSVSSLVVTSNKRLAGILTENDMVTRVMARGLNPERAKVMSIMSQPVIVVKADSPLEQAVQVMLSQGIKKLPVLGGEFGEELVGIISLTDVAMLYPGLYATVKQLQESQSIPVERGIDFYIC
jgi:CBS domain-containing protein